MASKNERQRAYTMAIILLVAGVLGYIVFSAPSPEEPVRLVYRSTAGNVLFDHLTHAADDGYALSCEDCHHTMEEDGEVLLCVECHEADLEDEDIPNKTDAFHDQCSGCHEDFEEAGPIESECEKCHAM